MVTIGGGAKVVIGTFAVERSQKLMAAEFRAG